MISCPAASHIKQHFPVYELHGAFHHRHSYDWILPTVALGDWTSSYKPFDFIINLNYPYHPTMEGKIQRTVYGEKVVYTVGLSDPGKQSELVQELMGQLRKDWKKKKNKSYLFHCYNGKEKSTAIMIAFLLRNFKVPLSTILDRILEKRSIQAPPFLIAPFSAFSIENADKKTEQYTESHS